MKKYFAKEIPSDLREAWDVYYNEEMAYDAHIFIGGNSDFKDVNPDLRMDILDALDKICDAIEDECSDNKAIQDLTIDDHRKIIEEYLQRRSSDKAFTDEEIVQLINLSQEYLCAMAAGELSIVCSVLDILYEESFYVTRFNGYGQSDWVYCIYPGSCKDQLKFIEAVYFDTGFEFEISSDKLDSADEFETADKYCDYFVADSNMEIKNKLARDLHCTVDEIALLCIKNTRTVVQYDYEEV